MAEQRRDEKTSAIPSAGAAQKCLYSESPRLTIRVSWTSTTRSSRYHSGQFFSSHHYWQYRVPTPRLGIWT